MPKSASSSPTLEATPFLAPSELAILVFLTLLSFFCFRWLLAIFVPGRLELLLLFACLVPAGENDRVGIGNLPQALILLLASPSTSITKKSSPCFAPAPFFSVFFVCDTNVAEGGGDANGSRRSIKSPSILSTIISLNADRVVDGALLFMLILLLILALTPANALRTVPMVRVDNLIVECPRGVLGVELVWRCD
jgi:hypothetical protein